MISMPLEYIVVYGVHRSVCALNLIFGVGLGRMFRGSQLHLDSSSAMRPFYIDWLHSVSYPHPLSDSGRIGCVRELVRTPH